MSKTFPGIRVSMGSWNYTTIRIKFSDLGETFVFQRYLDEENKDSLDVVGNREVNQRKHSSFCIMSRLFFHSLAISFFAGVHLPMKKIKHYKTARK